MLTAYNIYSQVSYSVGNVNSSVLLDINEEHFFPPDENYDKIPLLFYDYLKDRFGTEEHASLLYPGSPLRKNLAKYLLNKRFKEEERIPKLAAQLYFQNGVTGVNNASRYYFDKNSSELNNLELLYLLFILKEKTAYFLVNDFKEFLADYGTAFLEDFSMPSDHSLIFLRDSTYNRYTLNQSFTELVIKELKGLGYDEETLFRKGYKVHTTLDKEIQETINNQFNDERLFSFSLHHLEAGMAVINHQNGTVAGLLGGRLYREKPINRAVDITRQPASAFKPLAVYGPAIELGWEPDSTIIDRPITVGGFSPVNYDFENRGNISLREGLVMSHNVPTTWLLNEIGLNKGIEYLSKFGLFEIDEKDGYRIALGFTSVGTSPLAMANAFTAFANGGMMVDVCTITAITDHKGRSIYRRNREDTKIFSRDTADTMAELLRNVVEEGTGQHARIEGMNLAGKTGTTSYDGWFAGFNEKYTASAWLGVDNVVPENQIKPGSYPSILFKGVFQDIGDR